MKNQELEKPIHDLANCMGEGVKEIGFALARLVTWTEDEEEEPHE